MSICGYFARWPGSHSASQRYFPLLWGACIPAYSTAAVGKVSSFIDMCQPHLSMGDSFIPAHASCQCSDGIKDMQHSSAKLTVDLGPWAVVSGSCLSSSRLRGTLGTSFAAWISWERLPGVHSFLPVAPCWALLLTLRLFTQVPCGFHLNFSATHTVSRGPRNPHNISWA